MRCNKGHRKPKKLPYGSTKGNFWCHFCDAAQVPEWYGKRGKNIKAKERQRIRKEIDDILK